MSLRHGEAPLLFPGNPHLEKYGAAVTPQVAQASTFTGPGEFGQIFPDRPAFRPPDSALKELAVAMEDQKFPGPDDPAGDNAKIPAGWTYFGQFLDHDITFDKTKGIPDGALKPEDIEQARTPSLDLDSLYGEPAFRGELFEGPASELRFKIGRTSKVVSNDETGAPIAIELPHDLPRKEDAEAIIADPRNDENLIVAQTHLTFLQFHNRVLDEVLAGRLKGEQRQGETPFETARRLVRWHYQWVVLHDFLPTIVRTKELEEVRDGGRRHYRPEDKGARAFMPLEHSVAAYRMGHSMIRQTYNYNRVFRFGGLAPASLDLLFHFTGSKRNFAPPANLPQGAPIPSNWIIDWRRFFRIDDQVEPSPSRSLNTQIANPLRDLPQFRNSPMGEPGALALRNLLRGSRVGLPSGQSVADALGIPSLKEDELASGPTKDAVVNNNFHKETPLWFYLLKEADVQEKGERMGRCGSLLLSEVFVGLVGLDALSYLSARKPWKPLFGRKGEFGFVDLLRYVGNINPLGDPAPPAVAHAGMD